MSSRSSSNLDLLRSVAVITVMIDHLLPTLVRHGIQPPELVRELGEHIGHAGVLSFFVHTSLVLMFSLQRLESQNDGRLTVRFYIRRWFRIYPLAIACIVGVVLAGLPDTTWRDPEPRTLGEIVANLFLVQNLVIGHSVLVPMWSLPYEVEMYLVLPVLYWLARRSRGPRHLATLLAVSCIGGYFVRKLEHGHMNMAAYAPCFLIGVLCYALRDRIRPRLPASWWGPFVLALVGAYCTIHLISWQNIYWLGWAYCLVLGLAINAFHDLRHPWLNAVTQRIAMYSYGLYLLHVPALYVVFVLWEPASPGVGVAAFFALSAIAAVLAFHLIESPMMDLGRRWSDKRLRRPVPQPGAGLPDPHS